MKNRPEELKPLVLTPLICFSLYFAIIDKPSRRAFVQLTQVITIAFVGSTKKPPKP